MKSVDEIAEEMMAMAYPRLSKQKQSYNVIKTAFILGFGCGLQELRKTCDAFAGQMTMEDALAEADMVQGNWRNEVRDIVGKAQKKTENKSGYDSPD